MVYAQIKDNIVKNTIVLNEYNDIFLSGFDYLLRIDNRNETIGIGWIYNSQEDVFSSSEPMYIPIDLTTMEGCDSTGLREFQYIQIRNILWTLLITEIGYDFSGWEQLSIPKKIISAKWGLASYALRISVISDKQDEEYFKILMEESAGIHKNKLIGRNRIIEEMRQWVGLNYFRKEIISKIDIDDFYSSIKDYLNDYKNSNSPIFKYWLINAIGTIFENNGFSEKTYYSINLRDELINIYNGNY